MYLAAMPLARSRRWLPLLLLFSVASCSTHPATVPQTPTPRPVSRPVTPGAAAPEPPGRLPPVPPVRGPLRLDVAYPPKGAVIAVEDSSFLLGSVGDGTAQLTVNGTPVRVWPNGAFL